MITHQRIFSANKNLSPFLVGVSSFATNNSGYMFIGFIGFTYAMVYQLLGSFLVGFLVTLLPQFFISKKLSFN